MRTLARAALAASIAAPIVTLGAGAACDGRSAAPSTTPAAQVADHLLAHLPADTEAVVAGSLAELARWPVWRGAVGAIAHEAPGIAELIATRCGLDPWTTLDAAGLAFSAQPESAVLAGHVSVPRPRLHDCLAKVGAAGGAPIRVEDGPVTGYAQGASAEYAAWTGDHLFLAVPQRMDERAVVEALVAARPTPAALRPLLALADRGATVWGVAAVGATGVLAELAAGMPVQTKPIGLHAAIRRGDGLRAHVAFVFPDAASAGEGRAALQGLVESPPPPLAPWQDALAVEQRAAEVRLVLVLSAERARQLDDMLLALLPKPTAPPAKAAE